MARTAGSPFSGPSPIRRARGMAARLYGRRREIIAAAWLMANGYRILGFRLRTRHGEIDLLACHGRVLAVVEVKTRADLATALEAVGPEQRRRLLRAAEALAGSRRGLRGLALRLDLMVFARDHWRGLVPRHVRNAWTADG